MRRTSLALSCTWIRSEAVFFIGEQFVLRSLSGSSAAQYGADCQKNGKASTSSSMFADKQHSNLSSMHPLWRWAILSSFTLHPCWYYRHIESNSMNDWLLVHFVGERCQCSGYFSHQTEDLQERTWFKRRWLTVYLTVVTTTKKVPFFVWVSVQSIEQFGASCAPWENTWSYISLVKWF